MLEISIGAALQATAQNAPRCPAAPPWSRGNHRTQARVRALESFGSLRGGPGSGGVIMVQDVMRDFFDRTHLCIYQDVCLAIKGFACRQ